MTAQDALVLTPGSRVARVTLNRPDEANAFSPSTWWELLAIGRELATYPELRCVVIDAAGPSFCTGLDRAILAGGGITPAAVTGSDEAPERREFREGDLAGAHAAFRWIAESPFVTIAAVQGHAHGGGMQLALASDLRVLSSDAEFRLPETRLGIIPDMGAMAWLPRLVGYSRALDLVLTARRVGAAEASALGLADRVVPREELASAATSLAEGIAALPLEAVRSVKAATLAASRGDLDGAFTATDHGQVALLNQLTASG